MSDHKKNETKVVALFKTEKFKNKQQEEDLDPKLKSLQMEIDQGKYKIAIEKIAEKFLQKNKDEDCPERKKTNLSSNAIFSSTNLEILKKK